ncbi:hypothetical protein A5813_000067 [Enterococcus faecium]|uniref:hypothetical protein n=1 Tax=Enterococcus TaxID=1350 RepID=UPI000A350960|nr:MULTISPECIES: hypothetical protein [Enterococcus]EMF0297003.1 hypothetical protein [Enterococcus hirae]MEB5733430.1 hypothetical protein [Enterococcus hirae]OTO54646.1 hypothetical protein A5813_000067 [Enterococcus faecium]OTO62264.1 hypothetical protein A5812_001179 [Enterococcus faecium]
MNEKQLSELFKLNESNQTAEATFYEMQKGLTLIAKQAKYFYDQLVMQGFTEEQAMEFTMRTFNASNG